MRHADKPLLWLKGEVKTPPFSAPARIEAGLLLRRLKRGESIAMPHSRPMPSIGKAGHELRVPDAGKTWRVMYFADTPAIVILDVFAKTTAQTPKNVIDICKNRRRQYKLIMHGKE